MNALWRISHCLECQSQSQSQSHIATDGQSVSKSWYRAPSGAHDQIFIYVWQLRSCSCGVPSLTRDWICLLSVLLVLASTVFLGSESLGTWDHILLFLIWDFPFRRLLRLAGSRWRYLILPPHGDHSYIKSKSHCDWRSVSQSVSLGVEPHLGPMARY
jgi:hypothetical protein